MFESQEEMSTLFNDIESYLKNPEENKTPIFTDAEMDALILSFAQARGDEGFTEDECVELAEWAKNIRVANTLLEMVFSGDCLANWNGEEPLFSLTTRGAELAERVLHGDDLQDA